MFELEQTLIGACVLERDAFRLVRHLVQPDEMTGDHKSIWSEIHKMDTDGYPVDLEILIQRLGGQKSTRLYLNACANRVASSANIVYYCSQIIEAKNTEEEVVEAAMIKDSPSLLKDKEFLQRRAERQAKASERMLRFKNADDINTQLAESMKRIELAANTVGLTGVDTGSRKINDMTGGWQKGAMIVLAARPGMGKTYKMLDYVMTACENGLSVFVSSLEMTSHEMNIRMISALTGIDSNNLKTSAAKDQPMDKLQEAAAKIGSWKLTVNDNSGLTLHQISAAATEHKRNHGLDMIFIDYMQLIEPFNRRYNNRYEAVTDISKAVKRMAKEFDVPVMVLGQLSREVEKRGNSRPKDSDLRDSGGIEQDADMIIFLYRPYKYSDQPSDEHYRGLDDETYKQIIEIDISKHRGGDTGVAIELVDLRTGQFRPFNEFTNDFDDNPF